MTLRRCRSGPTRNPFAPGAGTQPPELAGRQAILDQARIALERIKNGLAARSQLLLGLRGVGKTVLLNCIDEVARDRGYETILLEARDDRPLGEMLTPRLRALLNRLSRLERSKDLARQGLGILRAFASAFKFAVGDIEFGVNPETGTADSGDLESDLTTVFEVIAEAARAAQRPIAILIDEVQNLGEKDLSALITAMHRISQRGLPCVFFGAGLPQLAALAGEAKSYAERLFQYPDVGALSGEAAREAIQTPMKRNGVEITAEALSLIMEKTKGYPYFLQEWGSQAWNAAPASPVRIGDVEIATERALQELDTGFFRVRLDRLTPREKDYMRAMAQLGPGPHRSRDIAELLGKKVTRMGPVRNDLIRKGMVFSPQHGETAFTVPMFDEFMKRTLPNWSPPSPNGPDA